MTIITAVLNDLEGLILCATSIGLSDGEFEHIIVDGQSSDGSFEYAQTLSDRPFTRVINQTSKPLTAHSKTLYYSLCQSDDFQQIVLVDPNILR